nr:hypothetical protein GCM10017611_59220 [Rhodococcus wratislaviensis]
MLQVAGAAPTDAEGVRHRKSALPANIDSSVVRDAHQSDDDVHRYRVTEPGEASDTGSEEVVTTEPHPSPRK